MSVMWILWWGEIQIYGENIHIHSLLCLHLTLFRILTPHIGKRKVSRDRLIQLELFISLISFTFPSGGPQGGSTEEAQSAIGVEVASVIVKFINSGSTIGAVNIPEVELKISQESADKGVKSVRVLNFHSNVPGVLKVY